MPEYKHISEISSQTLAHINDRKEGKIRPVVTPWNKFNNCNLGGLQWSDLLYIGGMSGSGKTAILAQLKRELHKLNPGENFAILVFTFEMPGYKLLIRDILAETRLKRSEILSIDQNMPINNEQAELIEDYLDKINQNHIYFVETPCTIDEYVQLCDKLHDKLKMNIISIADHSLLFKKKKGTDREMLVDVADNIIQVKNEGWSIHILLSQLNRDIESPLRRTPCSPFNFPCKSDLSSSDSGYQAADVVLITHRPYQLKFAPNTYGPDKWPCEKDDVYFHCLKMRESESLEIKMKANFAKMEIVDDVYFVNN